MEEPERRANGYKQYGAAHLVRVLRPRGLQSYADMLQNLPEDPAAAEFDDLPADADEHTRQFAAQTLGMAMRDLYDPAQLDTLRRVNDLLGDAAT